jgi:arylsulfatase A-like enzyme
LGLSDNTLIIFASDNGDSSHGYEGRYSSDTSTPSIAEFFGNESPTRGRKGDSYDGAFHVPALAWWPGQIKARQVSDHLWAFWDFLPTVAEIINVVPPKDTDGISFLPTLTGRKGQQEHKYLYWEYGQAQAVRSGHWFAHRASAGKIELFDLIKDPQQAQDVSARYPKVAKKMEAYMLQAHRPSTVWPSPGETAAEFDQRLIEQNLEPRPDNIAEF